jgi:hypothetical protein
MLRSSKLRPFSRRQTARTASWHQHRLVAEPLEDRRMLAAVTVDTISDIVDFGGSQLIDDLPGPDLVISLREALIATNNTAGADEVAFQTRGIFASPQTIQLVSGQLTISDDLVVHGPGATELTIDAQANSRVFDVDDTNAANLITVRLNGLTISGGKLTGTGESGAGIRNVEQLTVENSIVTGNKTFGDGSAGSGILNVGGNLTIDRSQVAHNLVLGDYGVGGGVANLEGNLSVFDSTLYNNRMYGRAARGGGLFSDTNLTTLQTTITNSTISSNLVEGYVTPGSGGGIHNQDGNLQINNCTITRNQNGLIGTGFGGGVTSFGDAFTLTHVVSSIISGNRDDDVDIVGGSVNSLVSGGHNLIGYGNVAAHFTNNDQTYNVDPGLSLSGYYGGITRTHLVLAGSPAIDTGDNPLGLGGEQRGAPFVRVDGGGIDVGATERQTVTTAPFPLVVSSDRDERDGEFGSGALSLREAIELANGSVGAEVLGFDTTFDTPRTLPLLLGSLQISDSLTVEGPGASKLAIDAGGQSRVLDVASHDDATTINVTLQDLTISGGYESFGGGGIYNQENLAIVDSVITGNAANSGGGIYNSSGVLLILDSVIANNRTLASLGGVNHGGGIANLMGGLTILDTTIDGNYTDAAGKGGGIWHAQGQLTIQGSTISKNITNSVGGGIYSSTSLVSPNTTIIQSTITGNRASTAGGGIFNAAGLVQLDTSTVTANDAPAYAGSGVASADYASSTKTTVHSTIISGNAQTDVDFSGAINSFFSDGYNLVGDGNATSSFLPGLNDQVGITDPALGPLANNGGLTWTHQVLAGSPAIDRGTPSLVSFDQRGFPFVRNDGGGVDVGSIERQSLGFPFIVDTAVDEWDGDYDPGDLSLREAIGLANGSAGADVVSFAFDVPQTIRLALGELDITDSVVIEGPGAGNLTVDAQGISRVFKVDDNLVTHYLDVTFDGLTITGGDTLTSGGGIRSFENLTVTRSTISGNSTNAAGGGVYHRFGNLSINESTISNNVAYFGGGMNTDSQLFGPPTATITNSTISGNSGLNRGGGIYHYDGLLILRNCTITDNWAPYGGGGGVTSYGDYVTETNVFSTIISGNHPTDVDLVGGLNNTFVSSGHNLIGNGGATSSFSPAMNDQVGITDPGLGALTNNGGPTWTHAVLASSPAQNQGAPLAGLMTDQRGAPFVRDDGLGVDVGATERQTVAGSPMPLVVDTAIDDWDGDYGPGDLSLREAIGLANGSLGFDVILFDTLGAFAVPQTIALQSGQLPIHDSVVIESPGPDHVVVDARGASRVMDILRGDVDPIDVALFGLTLTGGNTDGKGGGIQTLENLNIANSRITGNSTALGGGGIFAFAAPYVAGPLLSVRQTTISHNSSFQYGGGIASVGPVNLELTDSAIDGNYAYLYGGGISSNRTVAMITGSTVSNNFAMFQGGGIANNNQLFIHHSTISGNSSFQRGGGIYTATPYVGAVTVIEHSTITANYAPATYGSGVASIADPSTTTQVASSIIAGNVHEDVEFVGGTFNSFVSAGYNVIGDGNALGAFMNHDQTNITDPGLAPLGHNGGPTFTHALLPGSPGIDMGNPGFAPPPDFDQRGAPFARIYNGRIDVGAYEFIDGDFDSNGIYDCADVDALVAEIVAGTNNLIYDLNSDSLVNQDDLTTWLAVAGVVNLASHNPYLLGDANLDGVVDGLDFIAWNNHKFTPVAAWCSGDFNADGIVDGLDFIIWNNNKFHSSASPQVVGSLPIERHLFFDRDHISQSSERAAAASQYLPEPTSTAVPATPWRNVAEQTDALFASASARRISRRSVSLRPRPEP